MVVGTDGNVVLSNTYVGGCPFPFVKLYLLDYFTFSSSSSNTVDGGRVIFEPRRVSGSPLLLAKDPIQNVLYYHAYLSEYTSTTESFYKPSSVIDLISFGKDLLNGLNIDYHGLQNGTYGIDFVTFSNNFAEIIYNNYNDISITISNGEITNVTQGTLEFKVDGWYALIAIYNMYKKS